jgi:hypothetical protein
MAELGDLGRVSMVEAVMPLLGFSEWTKLMMGSSECSVSGRQVGSSGAVTGDLNQLAVGAR